MESIPGLERTKFGAKIEFKNADDLFEFLMPNSSFWQHSNYDNWIFRGHRNSSWQLLPKTFRENEKWELVHSLKLVIKSVPNGKLFHEIFWIASFAKMANRAGLKLPIAGFDEIFNYHFKEPEEILEDARDSSKLIPYFKNFHNKSIYNLLALAQHHGIPTRLLDVSNDPFKALFHAVEPDFKDDEKSDTSCIWLFNSLTLNKTQRYKILNIPNFENLYLYKQAGLFVIDTLANIEIEQNIKIKDIKTFTEESEWDKNMYEDDEIHPIEYPCIQILFPADESTRCEILNLLEKMNINRAILMPTYDNIKKALEFNVEKHIHTNGS